MIRCRDWKHSSLELVWRKKKEQQLYRVSWQVPTSPTNFLRNPCSVDRTASPYLTFLQHYHMLPRVVIDGVDVTTGFDAESAPSTSSWLSVHRRYIDGLASVELECRLCAQSFKVDVGVWVGKLDQLLHGLFAGVERNACWVCVHDEAVIGVGLLCAEDELLVDGNAWEWLDSTSGDVHIVGHLVQIGVHLCSRTHDGGSVGDVEVAGVLVSIANACVNLIPTYLWLVKLTAVSSTSSPINSTSYSISRLVFSTPSSCSSEGVYHIFISTVPGKPSSPSLLTYLNSTASRPLRCVGVGPSQSFFPQPCGPPCRVFGPLLAVS